MRRKWLLKLGTAAIVGLLAGCELPLLALPLLPFQPSEVNHSGWYLMVPPLGHSVQYQADLDAPVGKWQVLEAFGTARECEAYRTSDQKSLKPNMVATPSNARESFAEALEFSQCLEADDPRLAKQSASNK
jgi:hypothetical protein